MEIIYFCAIIVRSKYSSDRTISLTISKRNSGRTNYIKS